MKDECVFQVGSERECGLAGTNKGVIVCNPDKCPFYQLWSMLKEIKEE